MEGTRHERVDLGLKGTDPFNSHMHKEDPCENQLDDKGEITTDPDKYHIGIRNPKDLPIVRGEPRGL